MYERTKKNGSSQSWETKPITQFHVRIKIGFSNRISQLYSSYRKDKWIQQETMYIVNLHKVNIKP